MDKLLGAVTTMKKSVHMCMPAGEVFRLPHHQFGRSQKLESVIGIHYEHLSAAAFVATTL